MKPTHVAALALLAPVPTAAAQDWVVQPLVLEGDSIPGSSDVVTEIVEVVINDALDWRVHVDSDGLAPDHDGYVLGPAGVQLQEGQALLPLGAVLQEVDGIDLTGDGDLVSVLDLAGGSLNPGGLYVDAAPLALNGSPSTAVGFAAGASYYQFVHAEAADNGDVLAYVITQDPTHGVSLTAELVRFLTDGSGTLLAEIAVFGQFDTIPGTGAHVEYFGVGDTLDVNDTGSWLLLVNTDLATGQDTMLLQDSAVVAQEGQPSPVAGRVWADLHGSTFSLNDAGDHALSARLQGDAATDELIAVNGVKLVQEGDPVPGLRAFQFVTFDDSPISLSDAGEVLWYGRWNEPTFATDAGLFLGDELIVQEGVSLAGGIAIQNLASGDRAFSMSDDGRFVIFTATLGDGRTGAFLATPPPSVVQVDGCSSDGTALKHAGGLPTIGDSIDLGYFSPSPAAGVRLLGMSADPMLDLLGCGLAVPGIGELLVGITPPDPWMIPQGAHTGSGATDVLPLPVLNDLILVGATLHFQCVYLYAGDPVNPVDLTNGLDVTFGL